MNNDQKNSFHDSQTSDKLQNLSRRGFNATRRTFNNTPDMTLNRNKTINKMDDTKQEQKMVNPLNHQRPNLGVQTNKSSNISSNDNKQATTNKNVNISKNNDIGSRNLQKSLTNKARNILRNRNKRQNVSSSSGDNDSISNDNFDDNDLSLQEKIQNAKRRILIIKVSIVGLALFGFIFFVLLVAQIVTGGSALPTMPFNSSATYGTDKFASLTKDDSKHHHDEINFYKKLQEINKKYNGEINANYVNALLMQLYYESDYVVKDEFSDTLGFDFDEMTTKADTFADIIKEANSTDYAVDGVIFQALKNNATIKDYYKDVTKNTSLNDILKRAFAMAEELDAIDISDDTVVTTETNVAVKETKTENGKTQTTTKTVSMSSYLADSIYATATSLASESVKAYTIAYSTNVVSQNKNLSIDANTASANNDLCSVTLGCSYDSSGNLVSGGGSQSSKNTTYYNGSYYYKTPLSSSEVSALNASINSVYGNVLVSSDGTYPTLDLNKINGLGEGDYKSILNSGYGNLQVKNIGENSYILDGSYGTKKVKTEVIFYDQNNYPNDSFCGLKKETIETSGCGVTSMAMVVSTYENNKKYDPIYMNKEATNKKMCGAGSGTSQAFFGKEANAMKYKYLGGSKYNKSLLNNVLKHLSQGHLVIARMGPSHFTGAGHYIVLGGIDPDTKKVYVYDPNNRDNFKWRKTGNGWYNFNDIIVKEAYNFYIIWKG